MKDIPGGPYPRGGSDRSVGRSPPVFPKKVRQGYKIRCITAYITNLSRKIY